MKLLAPLHPQDTMLASISYPFWFIAGPYILASEKREEPFVKFHAYQGILLGAVTSAVTLIALIISLLLFQGAPSVNQLRGPVVSQTTTMYDYQETVILNPRNDTYMIQGCASMAILIAMGFIMASCFIYTLHCASRTWKGEFFELPIIGKYIEEKFFVEFIDE